MGYDFFNNDNTLYAPLAIVMTVRFDFIAQGENLVQSQASATIQGTSADYFRVLFTFSGTVGGTITNRGQSGAISGQTVTMQGDNRNLGSAIRPNKCGFAIGRGLTGRLREFAVYEGCQVFNILG